MLLQAGKLAALQRPSYCNCPVPIGQNWMGALRQLRQSMSGHLLWVDALCINQNDLDLNQRSQQVRMMGAISSAAE